MSALPLFFGFVFGAAIGTIATAASGQELHEQAVNWFEDIQSRLDRRKARKKETAQEQGGTWREYIQVWLDRKEAKKRSHSRMCSSQRSRVRETRQSPLGGRHCPLCR